MLTNPVRVLGDENGWVKGMECVSMELGEPDESGRRRPVEIKDSNFVLDVDCMIMAIGTSPNPLIRSTTEGLETNRKGCLIADDNGATTREGVFAVLLRLFWPWVLGKQLQKRWMPIFKIRNDKKAVTTLLFYKIR